MFGVPARVRGAATACGWICLMRQPPAGAIQSPPCSTSQALNKELAASRNMIPSDGAARKVCTSHSGLSGSSLQAGRVQRAGLRRPVVRCSTRRHRPERCDTALGSASLDCAPAQQRLPQAPILQTQRACVTRSSGCSCLYLVVILTPYWLARCCTSNLRPPSSTTTLIFQTLSRTDRREAT